MLWMGFAWCIWSFVWRDEVRCFIPFAFRSSDNMEIPDIFGIDWNKTEIYTR
jgi:hypothetical protein